MAETTAKRHGMRRITGHPEEVVGATIRVPLSTGRKVRYAFLDNAASTPAMRAAADAVNELLPWYASVHRGAGLKSRVSTAAYEEARDRVARFVGAAADQVVVFTKSATEGLNRLARMFGARNAVVITSIMEHHANLLPWRLSGCEVWHAAADSQGFVDEDEVRRLLHKAPTNRPRLLALAGAYNVTGVTPDIHSLARVAHENGAEVVIDAAQLISHRPLTVGQVDRDARLDYVTFSGHKIYAPCGAGVLVAPRARFEEARPDLVGGGIVDLVTLDDVVWSGLPDREEAGSPNVLGAVAIGAAMERLTAVGRRELETEEQALTADLLSGLEAIPEVRVLGPTSVRNRVGVVSFAVAGFPHELVAAYLSAEHGIGVRSGCFCAHPGVMHLLNEPPEVAQAHLNLMRSHQHCGLPGAVRVSLGIQNSADDVDRLLVALAELAEYGPHGDYVTDADSGECYPEIPIPLPPLAAISNSARGSRTKRGQNRRSYES